MSTKFTNLFKIIFSIKNTKLHPNDDVKIKRQLACVSYLCLVTTN